MSRVYRPCPWGRDSSRHSIKESCGECKSVRECQHVHQQTPNETIADSKITIKDVKVKDEAAPNKPNESSVSNRPTVISF